MAPPPRKMTGRFALAIISAALSSSFSVKLFSFLALSAFLTSSFLYSHLLAVTSFVISTSTGPGLPLAAILNALLIVFASFFTSFTMKLCFVIGMVTPAISTS